MLMLCLNMLYLVYILNGYTFYLIFQFFWRVSLSPSTASIKLQKIERMPDLENNNLPKERKPFQII